MRELPRPHEPAHVALKRFVIQLAVGMVGGFMCGLLALFVGMIIGGNLATNFTFAGNRGYEATGGIGLLVGLILGAPILVYHVGRRRDGTGTLRATLAGSVLTAVLIGSAILLSPGLRLPESVFLLTGLIALGATVGYNIHERWSRVAGYAAVVVTIIVAAWGSTLYRARYAPTVTFTVDLHGGSITSLHAVGADGSTADAMLAIPTGEVVQDGPVQSQFSRCIPATAASTMPQLTVRGQYFKPHEAIRVEATYTGADCGMVLLAGSARADAQGAFSAVVVPDPQLNGPPLPHRPGQ